MEPNPKDQEERELLEKITVEFDIFKSVNINDDYFNFTGNQDIELRHVLKKFENTDEILCLESQQKIKTNFDSIVELFKSTDLKIKCFPTYPTHFLLT